MICNSRFYCTSVMARFSEAKAHAHLESLVLQDALDGSIFARRRQLGLEDDAE